MLPVAEDWVGFRLSVDDLTRITPDGQWVTDRGCPNDIDVVNTTTGKRIHLPLPDGVTHGEKQLVAISNDGSTVAFSRRLVNDEPEWEIGTYEIVVWKTTDRSRQIFPSDIGIHLLALGDDGKVIASSDGRRINVLGTADGEVIAHTTVPSARKLTFSGSGNVIAADGEDPVVWPWRTGQEPKKLTTGYNLEGRVIFNPRDESIVAVEGDQVQVIRWADGHVFWQSAAGWGRSVDSVAFSASGKSIAYLDGGQGYVVDWEDGYERQTLGGGHPRMIVPTYWGAAVAHYDNTVDNFDRYGNNRPSGRFVHDGEIIAIVPHRGTVRSISAAGAVTALPVFPLRYLEGGKEHALTAISQDTATVVFLRPRTRTTYSEMKPHMTLFAEGRELRRLDLELDFTAIALASDGSFLAGQADGSVLRWPSPERVLEPPKRLANVRGKVTAIIEGRGGRVALAAGTAVWTIDRAGTATRHAHLSSPVSALAFGSSGDVLAAGTALGTVTLWSRGTATTISYGHEVQSVALSDDGAFVAVAGGSKRATIWPVAEPGKRIELPGDQATAVAFHPTDGIIAVGYANGLVQVWNEWRGGRAVEAGRFPYGESVSSMHFSTNGKYLNAFTSAGTFVRQIWPNDELLALACRGLASLHRIRAVDGYDSACGTPQRAAALRDQP